MYKISPSFQSDKVPKIREFPTLTSFGHLLSEAISFVINVYHCFQLVIHTVMAAPDLVPITASSVKMVTRKMTRDTAKVTYH